MKLNINSIKNIINIVKRWKRLMYAIVALGMVLTALFVVYLPSIYRSTVVFSVEMQNATSDFDGLTFDDYADLRIEEINRNIKAHVKLKAIISKYALYAENGGLITSNEMLLKKFQDDIEIKRVNVDLLDPQIIDSTLQVLKVSISYNSSKPLLAQSVADELASLILNENLIAGIKSENESPEFLSSEINRFQILISRLQDELAQYEKKNIESNSELIESNKNLKAKTKSELEYIGERIISLNEQKIYISAQLSEINRKNNTSPASEKVSLNPEVVQRLKNLQIKADGLLNQNGKSFPELKLIQKEIYALRVKMGEFDETIALEIQLEKDRSELGNYQLRYDDGHPDIIRLIQNILSTEDAIDALRTGKAIGTNEKSTITSNNLASIKLNAQLEDADLEIGILVESRKNYHVKLTSYERNITQLSQFEDKLAEVTKEYERALQTVRELKEKQSQLKLLGLEVDESKNEKIILLAPAQLPLNAFQPNRMILLILGALISFISGIVAVIVSEKFDDSVKDSDDLMRAIGLETLGEITYIKI